MEWPKRVGHAPITGEIFWLPQCQQGSFYAVTPSTFPTIGACPKSFATHAGAVPIALLHSDLQRLPCRDTCFDPRAWQELSFSNPTSHA